MMIQEVMLVDFITLRWDEYENTVTYHTGSDLPLLCTIPGINIAKPCIQNHIVGMGCS